MKRALPLILLALTGCAHTRYLTRSCITKEQYETLKSQEPPKVHDQLTGQADKDIRPIAGSNIRLRAYSDELLGVLGVCAS